MIEALPIMAIPEKEKKPWQKKIKAMHSTKRTDNHFFEVIKMIDGVEESIRSGNVYPERGRKCDSCDEEIACEKRLQLASQRLTADINKQGFFSFAAPRYMKPVLKTKTRVDKNTKRFKWKN